MSETDEYGNTVEQFYQSPLSATRSASLGKLAEALAKAQADFKAVHKNNENPYFKSRYADLSAILAATQPSLAANGIAVTQFPVIKDKSAGVMTMIVHSSGEWMSNELLLPVAKCDAQGIGSAITYARRYSLGSIVGVAAEVDDDGNAAVENTNGKGSKEAAQAVAQQKIDQLSKKLGQPSQKYTGPTPEEIKETSQANRISDLEDKLKKSIEATTKLPPMDSEVMGKLKLERVMGLITKIQKFKLARSTQEYRTVDLIDSTDAEMHFVCFHNHKYADGSSFFSLLDMQAVRINERKVKIPATLLCSQNSKGWTIERPIMLGDIKFDELGPVLDVNREVGAHA